MLYICDMDIKEVQVLTRDNFRLYDSIWFGDNKIGVIIGAFDNNEKLNIRFPTEDMARYNDTVITIDGTQQIGDLRLLSLQQETLEPSYLEKREYSEYLRLKAKYENK